MKDAPKYFSALRWVCFGIIVGLLPQSDEVRYAMECAAVMGLGLGLTMLMAESES